MKTIKTFLVSNVKYSLIVLTMAFSVISIAFNIAMQKNLISNLEASMKKDNIIISSDIHFFFTKYVQVVKLMIEDEYLIGYVQEVKNIDERLESIYYNDVIQSLNNVRASDDIIVNAWIGLNEINHYIIQDPMVNLRPINPNYNYKETSWYPEMIASADSIVISSLYPSQTDNELVFSVLSPVMAAGDVDPSIDKNIGQIGISLKLSAVQELVNKHKIGINGFAIVVDEQGTYIVKPDGWSEQFNIMNNEGPLSEIGSHMIAGMTDVVTYDVDGVKYYVAYSPVGIEGLSIATFVPVNELDEQINFLNLISGLIISMSVMILIISIVLGKVSNRNEALNAANMKLTIQENELKTKSMEVSAAYQQLSASEEELRVQYDEIESYVEKLEEKEKYIHSLAYSDSLTKIANRRMFIKKLNETMRKGSSGAVLLLDIDNFKDINDTRGHVRGDKLLVLIAEALMTMADEHIFISRFGGDEFLIMVEDTESFEELEAVANQLLELFTHSFMIDDDMIRVTVSIGLSIYPKDSRDIDALIMYADTAMYSVKNSGKNNYAFFDLSMRDGILEKATIDKVLINALKEDEFCVHYQPQINIYTQEIEAAEALIRLNDFSLSPAVFIPVAEETERIIEIGRWVTEEVIRQQAEWLELYGHILPVSINFSAKQLKDTSYIEFLKSKLKSYNVQPEMIQIEVTESIFIQDEEDTIHFIKALKNMGVSILLDDFGSGYSSLNYLTFIPIDKLKLDKALIDQYLLEEKYEVLNNIIDLAISLNIIPIVEGVEEAYQVELLKKTKCEIVQGYYYSKPLKPLDIGGRFIRSGEEK